MGMNSVSGTNIFTPRLDSFFNKDGLGPDAMTRLDANVQDSRRTLELADQLQEVRVMRGRVFQMEELIKQSWRLSRYQFDIKV